MYKNQLQELAQRSCFNLPAYSCIREGPDHAPRFKATVNFSGETFESPSFCTTLRQAEHSAAEVALNALATRGPSHSLAARILDETGVYKNLLQEVSQRVGACLPKYTTFRSRHGHFPVFSCTVELAGVRFTGEPAKTKKQAEKNAAMTAWSSLKLLVQQSEGSSSSEKANNDEQEHVTVARALQLFLAKAKMSNVSLPITFPAQNSGPSLSTQRPSIRASKILPFLTPRGRPSVPSVNNSPNPVPEKRPPPVRANDRPISPNVSLDSLAAILTANDVVPIPRPESPIMRPPPPPQKLFPAAEAAPYIPVRHFRPPHHAMAPPVTMRNVIPVFSAPPPLPSQSPQFRRIPHPPSFMAPPVCIRQVVPAFAAPPVGVRDQAPPPTPPTSSSPPQSEKKTQEAPVQDKQKDSAALAQDLQELKI